MSSAPPPDHRPAKRIRQACEPCRRKKSRCPGERPSCSHCSRLAQTCYYASDHPAAAEYHHNAADGTDNADTDVERRTSIGGNADAAGSCAADRLSALETRVAEVLGALNRIPWTAGPPTPTPSSSLTGCPAPIDQSLHPATASTLPQWGTIVSVAEAYLLFCNGQPLPLFDPATFVATLGTRDPELLFAILAMAVRFSDDPMFRNTREQAIRGYAEAARTLVMRRLPNGPVELSTLQALCLLSFVDFSVGNTHRASSLSSLALDLAESAGLSSECHTRSQDPAHEERRRCFWSVLFLKKLHGSNYGVYSISPDSFPKWPTSAKKPPFSDPGADARVAQDGVKDQGIIAYVIQLSEYWHKAVRYARRRANPGVHHPWSAKSEYSKIMVSMMEFESHMPYKHRFRPSKFAERPTEELEAQRDYWCPWLFSQTIYHTIMCLLNHPLILSLRLRGFRVSIPEIFLQHTADLIASHTDWIVHLIDLVEEKEFRVTDPFIGNCVAVVATIYLQQSFADDAGIRAEKRNNFLKCLDFVRRLGTHWPHIAQLSSKLQAFEATVSASYHDSSKNVAADLSPSAETASSNEDDGQQHDRQQRRQQHQPSSVFIDLTTFWDILEAVFTSPSSDASGSMFGSSLWPHRHANGAGMNNTTGGGVAGGSSGGTPHGEIISSRLLPEPTYPRGESSSGGLGGNHTRHNSGSTPGMSMRPTAMGWSSVEDGRNSAWGREYRSRRGANMGTTLGNGEAGGGGGSVGRAEHGAGRGAGTGNDANEGLGDVAGGMGSGLGMAASEDIMDQVTLGMGDHDELAVLAQSYFAQGQDFVRGVDDWWSFGQV